MLMLKNIELNGFKSFGKKSTVNFTTPVTSIVGPNGSGKSNIVEAIRFVLGEQSMKSLRGKGGVDLIFKGSKIMPKSNRASVSIVFDNSKKKFNFTNSGLGVPLDYDEVTITREVVADGVNKYSINGTDVRLKDIVDLLASVNIGSSGHHIISQGEADRVLNASSKDRRAMIEDALGLKIYQYRIKESERKLEKTNINMKEVASLRREIAPHINFLKKQVEKIEKAQTLRGELAVLFKDYLTREAFYIDKENSRLAGLRGNINQKISEIDERIAQLPKNESVQSSASIEKERLNQELRKTNSSLSDLARALGRLEGMIDGANDVVVQEDSVKGAVPRYEWDNLINTCVEEINKMLDSSDVGMVHDTLRALKERLRLLRDGDIEIKEEKQNNDIQNRLATLESERENLQREIENLKKDETTLREKIRICDEEDRKTSESLREGERMRYELMREKSEATSELHALRYEEEKLAQNKNIFESDSQEANALVGIEMVNIQNTLEEVDVARSIQEEARRKIERIKIRLEDAGIGSSSETLKEYNDTVERDQFLAKELEDLAQSVVSLKKVIVDLKDTLDTEFKTGVEKINKQFQEFFALMFGGGSAFLSIVLEHKKVRKDEDIDEDSADAEGYGETTDGTELAFERGIEINVSLPQKKVKDLHMLSGGERSLTSIALLFAMSQVNPPPFLVLDETDAALDEANSRKYGNMLENLSKYSQLIVVTHNRETMSRAQVLYGVTVGAEGASKLLSIKLEDASAYAK
jgi:chromosome segregation ATPase